MSFRLPRILILLAGFVVFGSLQGSDHLDVDFSSFSVNGRVRDNLEIERMLSSYRRGVDEFAAEIICYAVEPLPRDKPESGLANITVDALRVIGSAYFEERIDIGISNFGGLRRDLGRGPVTMGLVAELSPFENYVVLLKMDGRAVIKMANYIAGGSGMPISGMRIGVENRKATEVRVGGKPIDPDRIYKVVTIDYLLSVNKKLFPEDGILSREKAPTLRQRDAIVAYLKQLHASGKSLTDKREGRIFRSSAATRKLD